MLTSGILVPAYGRDYKSKAEIVAALNGGKDFVYSSFDGDGYVGIADLQGRFQVRYGKLRKVTMITITDGIAK